MSSAEQYPISELRDLLGMEIPSGSDYSESEYNPSQESVSAHDDSLDAPDFSQEVEIQDDKSENGNGQISEGLASNYVDPGDINQSRKRKKKGNSREWSREKNMKKRMKGNDYEGYTKKIVIKDGNKIQRVTRRMRESRVLGQRCDSTKCQLGKAYKCHQVSDEKRLEIFNNYWQNMDWGQKKVYICSLLTCFSTKLQSNRRKSAFQYHVIVGNEKLRVCKKFFLSTFGVGEWQVTNWKNKSISGIPSVPVAFDSEATKQNQSLVQRENSEFVTKFLELLPKMPSHYCRRSTSKLYLEPIYNSKSHLYKIYKEKCIESEKGSVSRFKFDQVVDQMNISLFKPKKDQCDVCVGYETKNIDEVDWKTHILKKDRARDEKNTDKTQGRLGKCHVLTIDMQAVKLAPMLKASAVYYKTKLCVHNFTVYNVVTHQCTCYWWHECEADLVASTFASCLIDHLIEHCRDDIPILIYSDGCTYQNRNAAMSNALLNYAMSTRKVVIQKYLEKGHTQMECDSVHSAIECKLKGKIIHLPSEYLSVCLEARTKPMAYDVKFLEHDFFKDYTVKHCMRYDSIRPGKSAGDPVVVDIRGLKYDQSGIIYFKLNLDDDWTELPRQPKDNFPKEFPPLYSGRLPLSQKKWNDLQSLKTVIPADCHSFYDNLPH